ncbi:hypothetical protein [Bacillus badius]|uniref:Spore germination protein n=1 Tax=Bacillus badius TaxID=1455 RepID=A0ABR5AQY6_BACBA|nr:hypothetical protein [Bacillus badius]KIL74149.1 Spore germination protein [Bacillus badius]KIL74771.1 Spore germination protein [Bacillus badius]KZR57488.1 hypothetical protein A3781_20010 [Bacillus badius]MED4718368.1 hypothetical protein [Bacillus badius]
MLGRSWNVYTYFSRLSDPEAAYEQSSFIDPVNTREILIALNEPPHEGIIPYIRLAKHTWKTNKKKDQIVQFSGAAFVTKNNLKNTLSYKEIKGLKWLNKDLNREEISIKKVLSLTPISSATLVNVFSRLAS